jgi:uncharacterized protein YjdB
MRKGLLLISFFTVFLFLVSCRGEHTHTAATEWKSDEYYHWHECTDETCLEMLEKAEHLWDAGVVTTEPTEQSEGVKTYTCSVCSKTKTEILSALEHSHTYSEQYSYDEVYHWFASTCEHKDEVKSKELHNYEFEQQTSSTCLEPQVLIGTCVCGDTTIKVGVPENGHKISKFESNNDATCTADGTKTGKCDVCNEILTYTDEGSMLGHNWVEHTTNPTYESDGEVYKQCDRDGCDAKETLETLPKLISVSEVNVSGKLYMGINTTQTLVGTVTPEDAHDKTLTWKSSNEEIATVDENGVVTALKVGEVTITATSHNEKVSSYTISVIETSIDAIKDSFYENVVEYTGQRSNPGLTQESYVSLGEKGIYVYLYVTDNSATKTKDTVTGLGNAHTEYYFTLGEASVLDNSFAVHLYYEGTDNLRTYTYNSTTNVARNNELKKYCDYSINLVSNENGVAIIAYELYVDYSYFGLEEAPENIRIQTRVGAGYKWDGANGHASLVNASTSGDYKIIDNYENYGVNGYIPKAIPVTSVNVTGKAYMGVNYTQTLKATVAPENATDKTITWTSSNEEIATVDANGLVTALKPGEVTITATSNNEIEGSYTISVIENEIDSVKDDFYDEVVPLSGKRTGPVVTHDAYIKLGENGISVYQLVTDAAPEQTKAHIELYFTLGELEVLDNSLSIHIYYVDNVIKSYTYSSSSDVAMNNKLAEKYCTYSVVLLSNENGVATYAYEVYIDYSYF